MFALILLVPALLIAHLRRKYERELNGTTVAWGNLSSVEFCIDLLPSPALLDFRSEAVSAAPREISSKRD